MSGRGPCRGWPAEAPAPRGWEAGWSQWARSLCVCPDGLKVDLPLTSGHGALGAARPRAGAEEAGEEGLEAGQTCPETLLASKLAASLGRLGTARLHPLRWPSHCHLCRAARSLGHPCHALLEGPECRPAGGRGDLLAQSPALGNASSAAAPRGRKRPAEVQERLGLPPTGSATAGQPDPPHVGAGCSPQGVGAAASVTAQGRV